MKVSNCLLFDSLGLNIILFGFFKCNKNPEIYSSISLNICFYPDLYFSRNTEA